MTPPVSSAFFPCRAPNRLPSFTPRAENRKVVRPMREIATQMLEKLKWPSTNRGRLTPATREMPAGQGVNAGGNGQQEHGPGGQIPGDLFLLCRQSLPDHIAPNDRQEEKGNPVIEGGNGLGEGMGQEKAQQRHQHLKAAKPQPHPGCMLEGDCAYSQPLANCHGKGIHRQPHGQDQKLIHVHF